MKDVDTTVDKRGSSHRCESAAGHLIYMVCLAISLAYPSEEGGRGDFTRSNVLPAFLPALRGREGERVGTL
jgi:hypothetical protein